MPTITAMHYRFRVPPRPAVPLAGAVPRTIIKGQAGGVVVVAPSSPCGNGGAVGAAVGTAAQMERGSAKRPDYAPVVAMTSQTMPTGFKPGALAFGVVIPEGR